MLMLVAAVNAQSAMIAGEVMDQAGQPVADAVVVANPTQGMPPNSSGSAVSEVLDQRNREFIPHVLVVRTGTEVSFPNNDKVRHHVYSFSQAKRFEIKLYKGMPPNPIRFDKPGIAILGCNIHDWMISYVYVSDSPYFTKTDVSGHWSLAVPVDSYKISIWHPYLEQGEAIISEPLTPAEHQITYLNRGIVVKNKFRSGKPPASLQDEGYKGEP